jgi:tetratricopeptide (TPR) repeat protein
MQLIQKVDARVERVEVRQKAAQIDPQGDPRDVFALIPDLVEKGDYETIITLGRAFLKVRRFEVALDVFQFLSRVPLPDSLRSKVATYSAYSLISLSRFEDAIEELSRLRRLDPGKMEEFWPTLALAFAYFKLGQGPEFSAWINKVMALAGASGYVDLAIKTYPELKDELSSRVVRHKENS